MSDTASRSPLAERFRGRRAAQAADGKNRVKTSIFIDADVLKRVHHAWKIYNHRHYPDEVMKAVFMEELLEHGLRNLDVVEESVRRETRPQPQPAPAPAPPPAAEPAPAPAPRE